MTKTIKTKKTSTPRDPLLRAARAWWASRRPCEYTLADHLANPTINTYGQEEAEALACVVARTYRKAGAR